MNPITAIASPNIAFIKYWGNKDSLLRLPSNSSISMNLDGLQTTTTVEFDEEIQEDEVILNGSFAQFEQRERVVKMLDIVRRMAGRSLHGRVTSSNNFPSGAGIASSASAFAALSLAASQAVGLELDLPALSRLARTGSGSACRSIPDGFVEWQAGTDDSDSYAFSIAPANHWDLVDCIAVVSSTHKTIGSTTGHQMANSSIYQQTRIADTPRRLDLCRQAILHKDFLALANIIELDSNLMHAVMQTSNPPLLYWEPLTLEIMRAVVSWRSQGIPAAYTIDAGPNVHVITTGDWENEIVGRFQSIPGLNSITTAYPGRGAHLV